MTTITTLTPLHIGTGNQLLPVCYWKNAKAEDQVDCYAFEEILSQVDISRFMSRDVLNILAQGVSSKGDLYSYLSPRNIQKLTPLYSLEYHLNLDLHQEKHSDAQDEKSAGSLQIDEQIKELGVPILPGSSLKGALECALKYNLLKTNLSAVRRNFNAFARSVKSPRAAISETFFLELAYGYGTVNYEIGKEKVRDFLHDLYGCIECRDIPFGQMSLMQVYRANAKNEDNDMHLGLSECISPNEKAAVKDAVKINEYKRQYLLKKYTDPLLQKVAEEFLDLKHIFRAVNLYTSDMMQSFQPHMIRLFEELKDPMLDWQTVRDHLRQASVKNESAVLRVGKYTDYFFKTVSWLFKSELPDDYVFFFENVFSPVTGKEKKADAKSMPVSTSLLMNEEGYYLPGFIRIDL